MLGDGRLHLSGIALLAPHLTRVTRDVFLRRATHRSKRQIEELIAEVAPREDVPALVRRLPERRTVSPSTWAPAAPSASSNTAATPSGMGRTVTLSLPIPVVEPLAPGRYKVQFTASARLHEKLERLQALMRSRVPEGDLAAIIEVAVTEKLERLEARRFAATSRPRKSSPAGVASPASRHIPAAVRRAVRERDGSRCCYVDASGRRCEERYRLEYHHLHPFAFGGGHRPDGIRLMCRAHNTLRAEHDYGREAMARFRRSEQRSKETVAVAPVGTG